MKILIDARELDERPTGVGRYLLQLLQRWRASDDVHHRELVLAAPAVSAGTRALGFRCIETGGSRGTSWEQVWLPRVIKRESPDVLFCPAYTSPLWTGAPVVLTIHDISFTAHPEWFTIREGLRRRLLTRRAARKAAAVITVSEFSASEIERFYGVPRSRIHVIHHGVAHLPRSRADRREPLVLFVGSIFNRRHVSELLAAVARLVPEIGGLRLVVVGDNRTCPRQDLASQADALRLHDVVEWLDYAGDERLAAFYARARAFVFVSEYEGFGLTPLEALAAGVPPVVADTAVSHETCGSAALYVQPGDLAGLAAAIRSLLLDESTRSRLLEAAPSVLARYSWERAAGETLELIEDIGRR